MIVMPLKALEKDLQVPRDLVPLKRAALHLRSHRPVVYDLEEHELGKLTDVLRTGSNDVYVVTADDGTETLLRPFPTAVVKSVDAEAKRIVVDPPVDE